MILNGKAREDFIDWKNKNYENELFCVFSSMSESSKNALIIEWFESIGYFLDRDMVKRIYKLWTENNWEKEPIIIDCMYCDKLSE